VNSSQGNWISANASHQNLIILEVSCQDELLLIVTLATVVVQGIMIAALLPLSYPHYFRVCDMVLGGLHLSILLMVGAMLSAILGPMKVGVASYLLAAPSICPSIAFALSAVLAQES
jgi:hypothetical protein